MSVSTDLRGRVALVTGATAGIGRAVARSLGEAGAQVLVHGRDAERAESVVAEIVSKGGQARALTADLTVATGVARLAAAAGEVDVLVNNAGVYSFGATTGTDVAEFDRQFAINTRAPFLLVAALVPGMATRGHGSVVTVSSSAASSPAPVGAAYGASKAAVELLTRSWAVEFGARGVRVNAVSPGPVRTDGTTAMLGEHVGMLAQGTLRDRAGEPEEIAEAVLFLVGDASSYINGTIVNVDGGRPAPGPA